MKQVFTTKRPMRCRGNESVSIGSIIVALLAVMQSTLAAQQPRESSDPYYQPDRIARLDNPASANPPAARPPVELPSVDAGNTNDFRPRSETQPPPMAGIRGTTSLGQYPLEQPVLENPGPPAPATELETPATVREAFEAGRVLARVGGQPIFVSDLAVEGRQVLDQFIGTAPESVKQEEFQKLIPRMLPKYIQAKVMYVHAVNSLPKEASLKEITETLNEQFDEIMLPKLMEESKVDSAAMLDAHYRALGSSLRRTRQTWAEGELVRYTIRTNININPEVSHRELFEAYMAERDEKWSVPARVRWERIMVRFDKFPTRQAAWDALAEMGNEVVYGASFAAVAKKGSQGFNAGQGGQEDWTERGSLADKKLEDLLFAIDLNELSDIHESDRGFEIVRVVERTDAGYIPFETAQPELREKLVEKKREEEFQKYMNEVKDRIPVEVFE